jgi:CheY-like chemotaxis protein
LLVQQDADNREMYAEFLRHKGLTPVAVSTGADALLAAPTADVIVTGILLSGEMDGLELIRELRVNEATRVTPIIVLTACAWTTERERAERAGCDAFLSKPCAPDELVREILRVLAASKLRAVSGKPVSAQPKRRNSKRSA